MSEKNNPSPAAPVDFDNLQGETFAGLNLLELQPGESDGPFVVEGIADKEFGKGKAAKTIGVVMAMKGTTPVQMPISASFTVKAKEANLQAGDTFYVKRGANVKTPAGKK